MQQLSGHQDIYIYIYIYIYKSLKSIIECGRRRATWQLQDNLIPILPQLLKPDYFYSTRVNTSENNNINYNNVLPFHLTNDDELDIFIMSQRTQENIGTIQ